MKEIIKPKVLAIGWLLATGTLLAGTGITTILIDKNLMHEQHAGYAIVIIILAASLFTTRGIMAGSKSASLPAGCVSSVIIWLSLLGMNALLFEGQYNSVVVTLLLIAAGCLATVLLGSKKRKYNAPMYRSR